jgi:o-succinylbenzoate synthase
MKIQSVKIIPYKLPLRQSWKTKRTALSKRKGCLVKITDEDNHSGYGDCAPLAEAGTETTTIAHQQLLDYSTKLTAISISNALNQLPEHTSTPAANCAIETALLDLLSQKKQQTLRQYLHPDAADTIQVNSMIGSLNTQLLPSAKQAIDHGFSTLKIKVGMRPVQDDIRLLKQLIEKLPEHIQYRLDANGSWSFQDAKLIIQSLNGLNIESIEEPLQKIDLIQLRRLQDKTEITLALDESIKTLDRSELLSAQAVRRIVIKPMVMGGLLPSLILAEQALEQKIGVVITSTIDSAIGIQATAQLAAALSDTSITHGLATSDCLLNNVAIPPSISNGILHLNNKKGLGLIPDE